MRLLEVEVSHWRGLEDVTIGPFSERLNLVCGPNESGKSRLFEAIRFALFESHKGSAQHKAALQSWGAAETPFVRLAFEVEGREYEISKRFLKGGSALLETRGSTLRGEDAEAALRELTQTGPGGAKGVAHADLGIWPILMIPQGAAGNVPSEAVNRDGLQRLHDRLSAEIGLAAVSPAAQKLMEFARREYDRYYTPTGQPGKALKDVRDALAKKRAAVEVARAGLMRQQDVAERLRAAQGEVDGLEQRRLRLVEDLEQASQQAAKARQDELALARLDSALGVCRHATLQADRTLQERRDLEIAIARLASEAALVRASIADESRERERLERDLDAASELEREHSAALARARQSLDRLRRERRRGELGQRRLSAVALIGQVETISADLVVAKQRLAELPQADEKLVARLERLDAGVTEARAKLQGAAVAVSIALTGDVDIDGEPRRAGERLEFDLTDDQRFRIGSVAEVTVRPGGGALLELRNALARAEQARSDALSRAGVASSADAAGIVRRRVEAAASVKSLEDRLSSVSGKPLPDLRAELAEIDAELGRLGAAEAIAGDETQLGEAVEQAERAVTDARRAVELATDARGSVRERLSALGAEVESKDIHRKSNEALLERMDSLDSLEAAATAAREALDRAVLEHSAAAKLYQQHGDTAAADAKRAARALDVLDARLKEARGLVAELRGKLQEIIASEPYESLQSAEAECAEAEVASERLERRAGAASALWAALSEARRKVTERLTQPVITRVQPYLQEIFPGSTLEAGEGFKVEGLRSPRFPEPYDDLSGGAREQLALVTRIAFAEVLAGDGRLPLLLDDALVNTDPQRILRVHRVLDRAAEKLQVIVFTCHDVLFDALGADKVFTLPGRR